MPEFRSPVLVGSQPVMQPVAPAYLGCLCIQVEVGDKLSQLIALQALEPRLVNAMQQWLQAHPGAQPAAFMTALDDGLVSADAMGLYPRSEEDDVVQTGHQLAKLLRLKPVVAEALGILK